MSGNPKADAPQSGGADSGMRVDGHSHGPPADPTVRMQVTLPGMLPAATPVSPAADGPGAGSERGSSPQGTPPASPQFVSMKPPSLPGHRKTPLIPAIERPEMKPRLRSLTAGKRAATAPSRDLGRYAPPRAPDAPRGPGPSAPAVRRRPSRWSHAWPYVLLTVVAAAVGAGIALWALSPG